MKIALPEKKSHFVPREILDAYVTQSDNLPIEFKCENDEIVRCSGRALGMISDFWYKMIDGATKFDNVPISFDFTTKSPTSKSFPAHVIKCFLDYVHLAALDEIDLFGLMRLLEFLCSGGRQSSEFEQVLAKELCSHLMYLDHGMDTKLVILLFMKSFDSAIESKAGVQNTFEQYAAFVKSVLTPKTLNAAVIDFDEKAEAHEKVVEYMIENELIPASSPSIAMDTSATLLLTGKLVMKDGEITAVPLISKEDVRKKRMYTVEIKLSLLMWKQYLTTEKEEEAGEVPWYGPEFREPKESTRTLEVVTNYRS